MTSNSEKKILMVCGSLRPGRDGVGDYSQRLALEWSAKHHELRLAALSERLGHTADLEERHHSEPVLSLRLREAHPLGRRMNQIKEWLGEWQPDVLSLQISPFGLMPRGLLGSLGKELRRQWPQATGQAMFHELWCGMAGMKAPFRERLLGWLQKQGIKRFLREFRPAVVHTSNAFYQEQLAGLGIRARILPLAGAIPVAEPQPEAAFHARMIEAGLPEVARDPGGWWLGAVFGSVYSLEVLGDLTAEIVRIGATQGRRVALVFLGHSKVAGASLSQTAREAGAESAVLGALPEEAVSQWMSGSHFGVCTTPMDGVGKSSSTAAFLDHGVPVLLHPSRLEACVGKPKPNLDPLILTADGDLSERLKAGWPRGKAESRAGLVAEQFLKDLSSFL